MLKCEYIQFNDAKLMNTLELSIRFGKTLIIKELDTIEGLLVPILRKDYQF